MLYSMQTFWTGIFLFPKKVIKEVEQLIRRFLWSGLDLNSSGAKVAWVDIATPKEEGGLGIRQLEDINLAMMTCHIGNLCMPRSTSMWVNWVRVYLIREHSFWDLPIPSNCSWTWRKLLGMRDRIRPFIYHNIGDGTDTMLWFDNWLPMGPILSNFEERVIYDSGLSRHARVSSIIQNGTWRWLVANSPYLLILKQAIPSSMVPQPSISDEVVWSPAGSGKFSTMSAWLALRVRHGMVNWHKLIWFPYTIPKCGFILWLAIRERLGTQDRLHLASTTWSCLLCNN